MINLFINRFIALCAILAFSIQHVNAQCNTLLWSDEFTGTSLNTADWSYISGNGCGGSSGCGFGNNELQYYVSGTNNITVSGGNLSITAKNQNNYNGSGANYTSGKIITSGMHAFRYGHFEASIKVPSATAVWPAFWMLPEGGNWPHTGEIDILETQNTNTTNVNQTLHFFSTPWNSHQYIGTVVNNGTDFSQAFHTYAIDWSPGQIVYSVDNVVTQTYVTSSVNSKGAYNSDWPFDKGNFYIILNLAVGGTYTGNATPVPGDYPQTMLVDYVRVYSTPATLGITGNDLLYVGDVTTYKINTATGSTINWSVPAGATIQSGQGTNTLTVQWNSGTGGTISVSVDPDGAGTCAASNVTYAVKTITKGCTVLLDDYESNRNISSVNRTGTYSSPVANPDQSGINTSAFVGQYTRNGGSQYDLIRINKFLVGNADDFRSGKVKFTMDVRTTAPQGTSITIEFNNTYEQPPGYPNGIHSQYTATTGPPNTWTKLTFNYIGSPDATLTNADVNRIQMLINPNSFTSDVYYIDNIAAEVIPPNTSAISGPATVCPNVNNISYSVTSTPGSTYLWTEPAGTSIASGQGTSLTKINFAATAGTVSVVETNSLQCAGTVKTKSVTISPTPPATSSITGNASPACNANAQAYSVNATAGSTYAWTLPSGASFNFGQGSAGINVHFGTTSGNITVTETNASGCVGSTQTLTITLGTCPVTKIYNPSSVNSVFEVFPNPFTENAALKIHAEAGSLINLRILDSRGALVYSSYGLDANQILKIGEGLPAGLYLIMLSVNDEVSVSKIIKTE
jgi:beta-glucanase (GH16 family)